MKKLMIAACAVAMACVAEAAVSYGISSSGAVQPYAEDTDHCAAHSGWYSYYVMKQADAQKAMVTTDAVTYQTMSDWLGGNFAANKAKVIANAEKIDFKTYGNTTLWQIWTYSFKADGVRDSARSLDDAICVFFYDDGKNVAYNVFKNNYDDAFSASDNQWATSSGWTAATVPEPTSGLLLLLGMAGLALKRKRA